MSGKIRTQREKRAAIRLLGGAMALGALPGVLALSAQPASAAPCYGDCKPGVIRAAGLLKYDAPVGVDDQITVTAGSGFVTVTDPTATFTAGAGCVMVAAHQARCDNVWGMKIRGLDGNDVIANTTSLPSTLDGGGGNDHLAGGSGDDVLTGGFGADNLQGGGGTDTADYSDFSNRAAIQVDLDGASGDDGGPDDGPAGLRDTVAADVENVTGSGQNDVLTGNAGPNVLDGAGGHDQIKGLGGDDRLIGRGGGTLDGGTNTDDCTSVLVTLDSPDTFIGCESTHVQN